SNMIGKVVVMGEADYQKWLGGFTGDPPEKVGEELFTQMMCNTCHTGVDGARGPLLNGLAGSKVLLEGGNAVVADDNYLRESILNPQAKLVANYQPLMPSFQGTLTQEQVNALIAYIKTLPAQPDSGAAAHAPAEAAPASAVPAVTNDNDAATTVSLEDGATSAPLAEGNFDQ